MTKFSYLVESNLHGESWKNLSFGIKSSIILEAIDKLYFPHEGYRSYMEFVEGMNRLYGMENDNPVSYFWGTEFSEGGKREKFTSRVKEIFHKVMEIGEEYHIEEFSQGCPFTFIDDVYFTAWKSHDVCMVSDEGSHQFNNGICDQWDGYIMGYVDLLVIILDYLLIEY